MVINIIISFWLVFLVVLVVRAFYNINSSNYVFQNYEMVEIPYITIDVQGHPLNLIVDSGAAVSIITCEALQHLSYSPSARKIEISATTSESIPANMVTIPLTVNGKEITEDFIVHTVDDLANFKAQHGIVAHGILGNEFFEKTGCKIDYKKHIVTLH